MTDKAVGYVEVIYLDSQGGACKTGIGAAGATWDETLSIFAKAQALQVDIETKAEFLCDLHDEEGDIIDTVGLTRQGVETVSGKHTLSDAEYLENDRAFWAQTRDNARAAI